MEQPISARFDSYFVRSRFLLSLPLPFPPSPVFLASNRQNEIWGRDQDQACLYSQTKNLILQRDFKKECFHDSAHPRVVRNLMCSGSEQSQTGRSVEGEFHLKSDLSLFYTSAIKSCLVWILFCSGVEF